MCNFSNWQSLRANLLFLSSLQLPSNPLTIAFDTDIYENCSLFTSCTYHGLLNIPILDQEHFVLENNPQTTKINELVNGIVEETTDDTKKQQILFKLSLGHLRKQDKGPKEVKRQKTDK